MARLDNTVHYFYQLPTVEANDDFSSTIAFVSTTVHFKA